MTPSTGPTSDAPLLHRDKVKRALRSQPRLGAIERTGLVENDQPIPALDRAVRVLARALRVPVTQVNIVTDTTLVPIAVHVEPGEDGMPWRERRPVGNSYCKYVVWTQEPFIVEQSSENRLVSNSNATRELGIGAYLGAPLHAPAPPNAPEGARGPVIGTFCAVDHVAREWTAHEIETIVDCATGVSELIAQRTNARAEVRAAEYQSSRVLAAAAIGVLATDANGVTTFANPAAEEMLGYAPGMMIGHDMHALIHHSYADGSHYFEVDCPNRHARIEGRTFRTDQDTFWRIDGAPLSVESTMTPIRDRGEVIGTVLTFHDVNERARTIELLRAARDVAESANRAKSVLLTSMAHELRVPLTAIGLFVDRLESEAESALTSVQRAEVHGIRRSQQQLLALTTNVLEFASIDVVEANSPPHRAAT